MIVLPDGKICRNLPEQVAENLKKIQEIIHFLDGVNIQDNLVVIADLSQILTAAELEVVERPVAFIYYNAELYIKKNEAAGVAYFVNVFSIEDTGTQLNFNSNEMQVNLGTGALTYTTATATSYTKSQIDSLLALKADLTGANFSGAVVAKTLFQTEATYNLTPSLPSYTGFSSVGAYFRIKQYANELHIVYNEVIQNVSGGSLKVPFAQISITNLPAAIRDKIFDMHGDPLPNFPGATWTGTSTFIRMFNIENYISGTGTEKSYGLINHNNTNSMQIQFGGTNNASVPNNSYCFRSFEVNLLLE